MTAEIAVIGVLAGAGAYVGLALASAGLRGLICALDSLEADTRALIAWVEGLKKERGPPTAAAA